MSSIELEAIQNAIIALPSQVPSGFASTTHESPQAPPVPVDNVIQPTPIKPRFAKLRSSFRRLSTKTTPKTSRQPISSGLSPPISPCSSHVSTVGPTTKAEEDTATVLLALLAPLVTSMQKLGAAIRHSSGIIDEEVLQTFSICCEDLQIRMEGYKHSEPDDGIDPHDLEMKTLLLDALIKKIETERTSMPAMSAHLQPPVCASRRSSSASDVSSILSPRRESDACPLILHSSAVLGMNRRSITPPHQRKAVPIGIGMGIGIGFGNNGAYPSFANAGQQTGLSDIFRLGSFQNSLLFSPSPVAVRRPAVPEPLKV